MKTKLALVRIDTASVGIDDTSRCLVDFKIGDGYVPSTESYKVDLSENRLNEIFLAMGETDPVHEDVYLNFADSIENKLVKFVLLAQSDNQNFHEDGYFYGVSDAVYCYVGDIPSDKTGSGKMLWMENGVMISSDLPVFVETLVTKKSKAECEQWDIQKWQHHRKHIDPVYMDFTNSSSPMLYEIDYDKMDKGDCCVVVAHFSDGSTKMSPVHQK